MIIDLVPRVRRALGVSGSYDSEDIPDIIRSAIARLLRDYNFPKSIRRVALGTGAGAVDGSGSTLLDQDDQFTLPLGFKRDLQVRFRDPVTDEWSDPLAKREAFVMPSGKVTSQYWLEGTKLCLDYAIDADAVGKQLMLVYQSILVDAETEAWITTDYEDAIAYLSTARGAMDFRKPDIATAYSALWQDEQASLAIYLNELEWSNVVMMQKETRNRVTERYPISAS